MFQNNTPFYTIVYYKIIDDCDPLFYGPSNLVHYFEDPLTLFTSTLPNAVEAVETVRD